MTNKLIEQLLGDRGKNLPRLSAKEAVILGLLSGTKEKYGLKLVEESNGKIGRGTVYVTLGRMEDKGFVESRTEEQRPGATGLPRRLYRLTSDGASVLRAWERAANALLRASGAT